jgi:translocation and assembly module TamA
VATPVSADLLYSVQGVNDPMKSNILSFVNTVQFGGEVRLSERDYDKVIATSVTNAREALRPFGYYSPDIAGRITRDRTGNHVLELIIDRGPPILVNALNLEIKGAGANTSIVRSWKERWPLTEGAVLDQTLWEQHKQSVIDAVEAIGFLDAGFEVHTLEIDLDENAATLNLVLDTGPQFHLGDIDFGEHVLNPGILEYVARFSKGDTYTTRRMDDFRGDLWKTGYFTDIEVEEIKRSDAQPPTVDLVVRTETKTRNSYQGAVGVGTDTGVRLQANWTRTPMSARGDRIDVGLGWQELNNEYGLRVNYRKPRQGHARQFWTAELIIKFENLDLDFKITDEDKDFITIANGDVADQNLRLGRLRIRNFKSGDKQLFTTPFIQYLYSDRSFVPNDVISGGIGIPEFDEQFNRVDSAVSLGIDADLVSIHGKGFYIHGHRERAWAFTSIKSVASNIPFTQIYFSSRRNYVSSDRWKFLVRAEIGYTDAKVSQFTFDTNAGELDLSITQLPNFYRFKAGGSQSVRGYAFEQLSNNNVGSNNVITASAEVEMKFLSNWSAALFVDVGNAFNDWSEPSLKTGVGVGIRWYSIAGPIRLDMARALDFKDKPWRIHFTIGSPLL